MTNKAKKTLIRKLVATEAAAGVALSDAIADAAEPGMEEFVSAKLLTDYLAGRGFKIERPWRQMPTAFRAVWGKGRPSIGMLAEYDALPNCGAADGTWGHGCGHNLLGASAVVGAVAAKGALEATKRKGRIVLWGCPAEEILAGKVYMARDGAFRSDDAIIGWHPGGNAIKRHGGSAMDSILFEFFGKTAHGASAHLGRSALDGVVLLDVGANFLREHVPQTVRIHMCIRDGGDAPNVVPAYAKSWYYVRGINREQVNDVRKRLEACAKGAALATGTSVKIKTLSGIYNRLVSNVMSEMLLDNAKLFAVHRPTAADAANVRKLGMKAKFDQEQPKIIDKQGPGSSDEDNVSWLAPFGQFRVSCVAKDTTGHHRDYASQMKLPYAHRGMLRAAEIFAGSALDLCAKAKLLARAKAEFKKGTKGFKYDPLVPARQKPPTVNP